tara:strand:+ start:134 stop:481 length:348 start_codon:yes stop_codon:yes gene_type:complete
MSLIEISFEDGKISLDESLFKTLNKSIPPTFINGINVIAITIIPIPPSHCNKALQIRILFGVFSKFIIIVEPVVVIPDILSKNESVNVKFKFEKKNGNEPKIATVIQDKDVIKKA